MEKKVVLALLMVTLLAGGVFAQFSLSAGLGGTFSADFINMAWTKDGLDMMDSMGQKKDMWDMNIIGGGFYAYFDATYAMLSLGMSFADISYANSDMKKMMQDAKMTMSLTTFDIGLLAKYPISLGAASIFPLLGVDFKIAVAQDTTTDGKKNAYNGEGTAGEYWSIVWFKLGFGADIPLGDKLYLRPMFLYGLGTVPKFHQEMLDVLNSGTKMADWVVHGLDVKLAVGYKF
jgi:hypothetical protein